MSDMFMIVHFQVPGSNSVKSTIVIIKNRESIPGFRQLLSCVQPESHRACPNQFQIGLSIKMPQAHSSQNVDLKSLVRLGFGAGALQVPVRPANFGFIGPRC